MAWMMAGWKAYMMVGHSACMKVRQTVVQMGDSTVRLMAYWTDGLTVGHWAVHSVDQKVRTTVVQTAVRLGYESADLMV